MAARLVAVAAHVATAFLAGRHGMAADRRIGDEGSTQMPQKRMNHMSIEEWIIYFNMMMPYWIEWLNEILESWGLT